MKKTALLTTLFIVALAIGLYVQVYVRSAPPTTEPETKVKEGFMQKERGMPTDMQTVEGPVGVQGYSGTPPLLGSAPKDVPLKPYDMANDNELFAFQNNKVSANCCPSPFSSDGGCVCLTDAQIAEFGTRGGNRA
jgi:hypothetical protein